MWTLANDLNSWIVSHQALVATIAIPFLTLCVSHFASRASEKRAEKSRIADRSLQTELKLAEFRQTWISELRDDLALFHTLSGKLNRENFGDVIECVTVISRIKMRMNAEDPQYNALSKNLYACVEDMKVDALADAHHEMVQCGQDILKIEWERLKADLRSIDRGDFRV